MFSWNEYDTYITKMLFLRDDFKKIEGMQNYIDNVEVVTNYQNDVVKIGTLLEKHLDLLADDNKDVIHDLEHLCDHIFEWFSGSVTEKIEKRKDIYNDFESFFNNMQNHCMPIDLAICAVIRNEAKYIEEWLMYHIYYGVKKFYIYDNESNDGIKELLKPYIKSGIVDLIQYPGENVQFNVYNDAISRYKDEALYIAFIDADEFLTPVENIKLPKLVRLLVRNHSHSAALGVNWRVYGTSGYINEPEGLVIENYVMRAEDRCEENKPIKTIANPRRVEGFFVNAHEVKMKEGFFCTSELGTPIIGPYFNESDCTKIRINHYVAKSKQGFIDKRKRGWPDQPHIVPSEESLEYIFELKDSEMNKIKDESACKLGDTIRELVKNKNKIGL